LRTALNSTTGCVRRGADSDPAPNHKPREALLRIMARQGSLRRKLWPKIDGALDRLGGYAVKEVHEDGYVGTASLSLPAVERVLEEAGFEFELIAALKHRACPDHNEVSAGSWVLRDGDFAPYQLHVHLFSGNDNGYTDVYAHHEHNWKRRPLRHYAMTLLDNERGVEMTREILAEEGVELFERGLEERCMF